MAELADWPGDVRELGNAIERTAGLGTSDLTRLEDMPEVVREQQASKSQKIVRKMKSYKDGVTDAKRPMIDEGFGPPVGTIGKPPTI